MLKMTILMILLSFSLFADTFEDGSLKAIEEPLTSEEQSHRGHLSIIVPKCDHGDPQSCYELALFVTDETLPYQKHPDEAITYYTKACEKNHYDACANLSAAYSAGTGTPQNHFKAFELSQKGCEAGHARSCYNLATNYYNGHGIRIDRQRAEVLFGKACDLKDQDGCTQYALLIQIGR